MAGRKRSPSSGTSDWLTGLDEVLEQPLGPEGCCYGRAALGSALGEGAADAERPRRRGGPGRGHRPVIASGRTAAAYLGRIPSGR